MGFMRIVINILILSTVFSGSSFAACESEIERRDRNKKLCEQWEDYTKIVIAAGTIVGAALIPGVGGLCGAAGLAPGVVTKRVCDLAKQKEEIVKQCLEYQAYLAERNFEREKEEKVANQTKLASEALTSVFFRKKSLFEKACQVEMDNIIESYIDSDKNLDDPDVRVQMQVDLDRIQSKYF